MYDDGKVLLTGGSPCAPYSNSTTCINLPTATAETIDLSSDNPNWNYTGSMAGLQVPAGNLGERKSPRHRRQQGH